jgi:choline kinase
MCPDVVIPAAGLGTRMNDYTRNKPKCLVEVAGTTILEHQLDTLSQNGIKKSDIYVVIGTKGECWTQESYERITNIHDNIVYNFENTRKGPAFSLALGLKKTSAEEVMILDGDVFVLPKVTQSLFNFDDSAIVSRVAGNQGEPGSKVVTGSEGEVKDIGHDITPDEFPWYIHSGITKITGKELSILEETARSKKIDGMDAADVLEPAIEEGNLKNMVFNNSWVNMNRPEDIDQAISILE